MHLEAPTESEESGFGADFAVEYILVAIYSLRSLDYLPSESTLLLPS